MTPRSALAPSDSARSPGPLAVSGGVAQIRGGLCVRRRQGLRHRACRCPGHVAVGRDTPISTHRWAVTSTQRVLAIRILLHAK
jgi:hypothetical protein